MQLDRHSAVILPFPRSGMRGARRAADLESGRIANLALMLVVFGLAALWLAFPPAQLPVSSAAGSAQSLHVQTAGR